MSEERGRSKSERSSRRGNMRREGIRGLGVVVIDKFIGG